MKQGDIVTIDIIDVGTEGEGIGRAEGLAVFVPETVPGDRVQVELAAVKKSFARGQVTAFERHSLDRQTPFCPYAGQCGGCSLQAMTYEAQLRLKEKWVRDRLQRIGGIQEPPVATTLGMNSTQPKAYRNKAQFLIHAGSLKKNREGKYRNTQPCRVGFYRLRSHEAVDCRECAIQSPPANALAEAVRQYIAETGISIYDEKSGMGLLRHVVVKAAFATGEVMAIFVVNGSRLPKVERLVELCDDAVNRLGEMDSCSNMEDLGGSDGSGNQDRECGVGSESGPSGENNYFWSLESLILNINRAKGSEILGKDCQTIAGKPTILDRIGGLTFEISPLSFYQVNPAQTVRLYDTVREYAALTGRETVLDLYCGVGTIGLHCASQAARVIGVEAVKQAVLDANRNAVLNGIVNAEYICGKAEDILPKRLSGIKADVVILDPPRSGCQESLLQAVLQVAPARIVYVSCDPATMARDIKLLTAGGYALQRVQPVDMFPHTIHAECVVWIQRKHI